MKTTKARKLESKALLVLYFDRTGLGINQKEQFIHLHSFSYLLEVCERTVTFSKQYLFVAKDGQLTANSALQQLVQNWFKLSDPLKEWSGGHSCSRSNKAGVSVDRGRSDFFTFKDLFLAVLWE